MDTQYLYQQYNSRKDEITKRLKEFSAMQQKSEKELFAELAFCLLTPQSNGRRCWQAIEKLMESNILYSGNANQIKKIIKTHVRFHNTKAQHIVHDRKVLNGSNILDQLGAFQDGRQMRGWLVKNIRGFGYKEASHFLRNIGYFDVAILDRHILKNLVKCGVIESLPKSLTPKKYLEIEEKMKKFADKINIPFPELDLLFWSEETGEIFK